MQKDFLRLRNPFFHLVEMLQPPCYQIRLFFIYLCPMYLVLFLYGYRVCTGLSHEMVGLLFCSKHVG